MRRGFTLIEMMIVVAIIAIVAARRNALETTAVGSMRAYADAQQMFHRNDWDGDGLLEYATPYTLLNNQLDSAGDPLRLIDSSFSAAQGVGSPPRHGYIYQDLATIGGAPINWVTDCGLCAIPAVYGRNGYRTFIINISAVTYGRDQGPGSGFVADYPVGPAMAGWVIAE